MSPDREPTPQEWNRLLALEQYVAQLDAAPDRQLASLEARLTLLEQRTEGHVLPWGRQ